MTSYAYANGLPIRVTDPEGVVYTLGYDAASRLTSITDADNNTTTLTYDGVDRLTSVTNPLGHRVSMTYNSRNNLLTFTDANGNVTQRTYDGNGNLISQINALGQQTRYEYDAEERLIHVIDAKGGITQLGYDASGRLISITNPLGQTQTLEYDAADNLLKRVDAFGKPVMSLNYDELNNLTEVSDALANRSTFDYDALSRLVQSTDPVEAATQFRYDDINRLVESVDALTGVSSQGFDADGNRDSLTDPNSNETRFDFDKSGRLVQETLATADQVNYTYNARNLLASVTNRRGQQRQFEYDAGGRITRWTDPDGSVSFTYDANGNVLTVTDSNGTITREYDKLNRVTKYTDIQRNTLQYAYDEVGNLVALTYPDGRQVHYEYDAANQLIKVTDWAGRETHYEYDLNGRLINTLRPNGTQMTRVYDDAGQLLQQKEVIISSGELINQFDFAYNAAGDIVQEQIAPEPNLEVNPLSMTYAAANRLATYDGSAVQLDADGNMIVGPLAGGMANFAFDSRNRLVAAGNTAYRYDAENQRLGVSVDGQETRYVINSLPVLSQVLVRTQPDGTQTYYVYGLGLIGQEKQGQYLTYHFDFRGSTVALTDETGQVVERFQYSPYGFLLRGEASTTPFLFNGMYGVMTDSNGLYYMRARYYHSEIRRFVNQDVLLGNLVEGQTLNRYAYVTGRPVSFVDPFGLSGEGVDEPGFWESFIPIWGSGKAAMFYYQNGQWFWGTVNAGLAVTDVFLVKALVTGTVKSCLGIVAKGGGKNNKELILNIGSGNKPIEGAINLDIVSGKGVDVLADVLAKHLPFKSESIDKIVAQALPSPLIGMRGEKVAENMYDVLKPGGTVFLTSRTHFHESARQIFLDAGFTEVTVQGGVLKATK